jgi:hypothetical protein
MKRSLGFLLAVAATLTAACAADEFQVPACGHGPTEPVTIEEALSTLRAHSFTVFVEEESELCGGSLAEEAIGNVVESGPNRNVSDFEEISKREGMLLCTLRPEPLGDSKLYVDTDAPPASPIFSGDKAEFGLANFECTLYPEGDGKAEQVARLHDAFRELERGLR